MTLAAAIDAQLDRIVPAFMRRDPDVFRQAKRVAAFDVAFLFWVVLFAGIYLALGSVWCASVTLWAILPILGSLFAMSRGHAPVVGGNLLCLGGWITLTSLGLLSGGWTAIPPMLWYTVLPIVAVLTCSVGWGLAWTLISVASVALFGVAQAYGITFRQELSAETLHLFGYAIVIGLLLCQFVLAWVRVGIEQRALAALHEARQDLARARSAAAALKAGFGISVEDWDRVRREKAALEYFVQRRFGTLDDLADLDDEEDLDDADLDDSDLEDAELDDVPFKRRQGEGPLV